MDSLFAPGRRLASPPSRPWRRSTLGTAASLSRRWPPALPLAGLLPAVLAAVLMLSSQALAHQVNVFAVAESGVLRGEGYFGGGAKARDCAVEAVDATGAVLASGRTGQDGTFALALPAPVAAPLTVTLKAGEGHRGEYTLTAADLGAAARPTAVPAAPAAAALAPAASSALPSAAPNALAPAVGSGVRPAPKAQSGESAPCPEEARLAALVEASAAKAVEEKLAPLKLELAKLAAREDSARFRDLIGGLGWIAGLLGLAAWLKRPKS